MGQSSINDYSFFRPFVIITLAVAVQSFHMLEHIAQVFQKITLW